MTALSLLGPTIGAFFFVVSLAFLFLLLYSSVSAMWQDTWTLIMQINKEEKEILATALTTEHARVKRAVNAEKNGAIREILSTQLHAIAALAGRVSNEVVK